MKLLIRNGRVIDPANNLDAICDVLIENTKILQISQDIQTEADTIIDASEKIVLPGLVDMHVHLREPGREDKETVLTGTNAAIRGGVTSLLAMPNTNPAMDLGENIKLFKEIIYKTACANVFVCGALTMGRLGKELADFAKLKKEGAIALSDDGASIDNDRLMLEALKQAKKQNLLVISHCEDKMLSLKGVVNLGLTSTRMGLAGISKESEYKRVARDIRLAQKIGAVIHIAHISCKESVEIIAQAKKKGVKVTAETCPHYFFLTEEEVLGFDTNFKMNPPLRAKEDVLAIRQGLCDGTIDVIASDHAPHTENEKEIEFDRAEFGVIGLQTELAVSIAELVKTGLLDWLGLAKKLCLNPAKILGVNKGALTLRRDADITIIDPQKEWLVKKEDFVSKSKNSAFLGKKLTGIVEYAIFNGKISYKRTNSL
ncbi:MAG: dihydroorotase [Candidatus Omnitrophota bacterium]|nr:dihydroorotase [Candidatus Omnitrophota bacterium]